MFTADSLTLDGFGGNLLIAGTLGFAGTLDTIDVMTGTLSLTGLIQGATILPGAGAVDLGNGGTLSGVTYQGVLALTGLDQTLFIQGGLTLETAAGGTPGTIDLSGASDSGISILDSETLDNATLNFGTGNGNSLSTGLDDDTGQTLTLGSGFTIDVTTGGYGVLGYQTLLNLTVDDKGDTLSNAGLINADGGSFYIDYGTVTNTGTIDADDSSYFTMFGSTFDNSGSMAITGNGYLDFQTNTASNEGTITVSTGGYFEITGPLTNTGTISVDDGRLRLDNGFTGAGSISVTDGGTIVLGGSMTVAQVDAITGTNAGGTIQISGTLDLGGETATVGVTPELDDVTSSGTVANGTIVNNGSYPAIQFGGLSDVTYQGVLTLSGYDQSLTIQNGITLEDVNWQRYPGKYRSLKRLL